MKPILSQTEDKSTLQDLGRASIQIVHDLKNQLNGLKLYATFLRKRLEKSAKNAVILPSNAASSYGTHHAAGEEEQWRVERVSFAAHCTQDELLDITQKLSPRQIILIHGSKRRISDLAFRLAPNHKIHTPAVGETVRTIL